MDGFEEVHHGKDRSKGRGGYALRGQNRGGFNGERRGGYRNDGFRGRGE